MTRIPKKKAKQPTDDFDVEEYFDEVLAGEEQPKFHKGWPVNVPILVAADLAWNFTASDGSRDLLVWLEQTFDPDIKIVRPKAYRKAYRALLTVISERFEKSFTGLHRFLEFTWKNRYPSKEWQAACWNEMLHQVGYEIPKRSRADPGYEAET